MDIFSETGTDIYTGKAYEEARLPESSLGQGTCGTSAGGLEPPTGPMTGEPVLSPVAGRPTGSPAPDEAEHDPEIDGMLYDFFDEDGVGDRYGLKEIPGGIGVDSCASDNVMSKSHLKGFTIRPSAGSKRGQKWGSASGHTIPNEGECTYSFMTEHGDISRGTTQVGEVRRPLAAVSKITAAGNIAFFADGDDCIISRADPVVKDILALVR